LSRKKLKIFKPSERGLFARPEYDSGSMEREVPTRLKSRMEKW
jgi:hypothetical protein